MNTTPKFLTNFWVEDENGADGEDHQKDWFTDRYTRSLSRTSFTSMISSASER